MAEKMRKLTFWENFYIPMKRIGDRQKRAEFALKVLEYAFDEIQPELDDMEGMAFDAIAPLIDEDMHGNKGGRPRKETGSATACKTASKTSSKTGFKTPSKTPLYESKGKEGNGNGREAEKNSSEKNSFSASASDGAAAAGAAPPSTLPPRCPECDGLMKLELPGGFFRCRDPKCRATVKPGEIAGCLREVKNG